MNAKILICIPCHERRRITELCVPTVHDGMGATDVLNLYNDGSNEYGASFLFSLGASNVHVTNPGVGIERQRKSHFLDFARSERDFTHLYLTDSDALHDPRWREHALWLQDNHGGAPVCLYNTAAHETLVGNTINNDPKSDVIWRRVAPGISYLLTTEHVKKVMRAMPEMPPHWHWDWTVPAILGHKMAISRVSHVDHIGLGGMHHPTGEGLDGGDRALNPTKWLVAKRTEVVRQLTAFDYAS